ncbi:V-type ATP synthase subunit D [Nocardia terpenica]|uniref:V-type ATPase, D subunit n=1 Tax=Nocardia terpenica TaxID=455432 RepID=A0A291RPP8_9NOCA|nr:V-type ATP synthase subunit D [Nocardia terpenica]ATL69295.1 V-type ATPase, D subunit [Nocardia terpenica]
MAALRIPPGRAGRVWLRDRIAVADSALSLLERKRTILEQRHRRQCERCARTGDAWAAACTAARTWQLRAQLAGGQRSLTLAAARGRAEVTVDLAMSAGVRYPERVRCTVPRDEPISGGTVLLYARTAHADALAAAAEHAAALAAVRALERELAATRVRAQALRHRRIPALRSALTALEVALEERERAERISLLRAARTTLNGF